MRAGDEAVYKLGQKVRHGPDSPERVALTNIYLQRHEFELLAAALDGAVLHKTRVGTPARRLAAVVPAPP